MPAVAFVLPGSAMAGIRRRGFKNGCRATLRVRGGVVTFVIDLVISAAAHESSDCGATVARGQVIFIQRAARRGSGVILWRP